MVAGTRKEFFRPLTHIPASWWICIRQDPKHFLPIQRIFSCLNRSPLSPYPNFPTPTVTQTLDGFRPSVNNIFCSGNTLGVFFPWTFFHIYVSTATQTNFVFNSKKGTFPGASMENASSSIHVLLLQKAFSSHVMYKIGKMLNVKLLFYYLKKDERDGKKFLCFSERRGSSSSSNSKKSWASTYEHT